MRHKSAHFSPASHICINHTFKDTLAGSCSVKLSTMWGNTRRQTKREELEGADLLVPQLTVDIAMIPQAGLGLTAAAALPPGVWGRTIRLLSLRELSEVHLGVDAGHTPSLPEPHSKPGLWVWPLEQASATFLPKAPLLVPSVPKARQKTLQCPQDQPGAAPVLSVHTLCVIHGLSPGWAHSHWQRECVKPLARSGSALS